MDLAVVAPAKRHGELIAHFTPERWVLCEPQVMGVRGSSAANQTRVLCNRFDVMLGERLDRVRPPQKETVRNAELRLLLKSVGGEELT